MITLDFVPKNHVISKETQSKTLTFYTMWQDRFTDTDDFKVQKKEVDDLLALLRKPRNFKE